MAERGPLPPARGDRTARLDVPSVAARAVLPLRVAGVPGDGGDLQRDREGAPGVRFRRAPAATSRRSSGGASTNGRASRGRTGFPPDRAGRLGARRRRERLIHHGEASTRFSPTEVWEAKNPWLLEKVELAPDRAGPGGTAAASASTFFFHALQDCYVTSAVERTKNAPWGLEGGGFARPNGAALARADGVASSSARRRGCSYRRGRRSSC